MPRYRGQAVAITNARMVLIFAIAALGVPWSGRDVRAQDMEPRAYSASPIDTNFLLAGYSRTTGAGSLDPSLPISNVKASINTGFLGYDRTFDFFGQTASGAIAIPYFQAGVSGDVFEASQHVSRKGLGDIRLRITDNFIGNPAVTPAAFADRLPATTGRCKSYGDRAHGRLQPSASCEHQLTSLVFQAGGRCFAANRRLVRGRCGRGLAFYRERRFLRRSCARREAAVDLSGTWRLQFSSRSLASAGCHPLFRRRHHP
jgi:hypothetical protein